MGRTAQNTGLRLDELVDRVSVASFVAIVNDDGQLTKSKLRLARLGV